MATGYELSHGAKNDRASYLTPPPPGSTLGYENATMGVQIYTGPIVLMSLHVDIGGGIQDPLWIQVYDQSLVLPDGTANALDGTNAGYVRRSKKFLPNDADLTWDFPISASDAVEDYNPINRSNLNGGDCDDCKDRCFDTLPILGYPFDHGIVVTASLTRDTFTAAPKGVIRISARMRYRAASK